MTHKILICGEAFGEAEERAGLPFVGPSGRILDGILSEVGIPRAMCYITNVVMERPPGNDFSVYYDGKKPTPKLLENYQRLYNEIATVRPNLIVALGAEALKALTPHSAIQHWRGSIIETPYGKVLPVIHPAAILREWLFRPCAVADMQKAASEMEFPQVRRLPRELVVSYNFDEVMTHLKRLKGASHVAFDIETETDQITCIGLSDRRDWAICVPFWFGTSGSLWSQDQETELWTAIQHILQDEKIVKIGHNGSYDIEYIRRCMSFDVRGYEFDTMLGFHCLYAELPKGLDYLVSIYTDHPYYKFGRQATTMGEHFKYNATDACLTFECYEYIAAELAESNLMEFYRIYIHALIYPLMDIQRRGVCFNNDLRATLRDKFRIELEGLQLKLDQAVGHPLNINSPKQMKEWLYGRENGGLGLKARTKARKGSGETTVSADEEALTEIYKETKNEAIAIVLAIREKQKILSTYLEVELDADQRIRCSYLIHGTETGRLSSRRTSRGTGTNLQNIPPGDVKRLFIADSGYKLINADLSQAEARVVAYLCSEERLVNVFAAGGDIHRRNAANIFGIKEGEVTDDQRQLAKRVVHASNYGMGPRTFGRQVNIPESQAKRLLNQYFATYPGIKRWHGYIADELRRKRQLKTPFGRRRIFFGRWGDGTIKEGLAFIPQSTVAEIVNQALIELHKEGYEILLQVHDSIVLQAKESELEKTIERVRKALTRPVEIGGRMLVIPTDVKVGDNWEDLKKYEGSC